MISRLLKLSLYRGGPHFDRLSTLCFNLEGIALELSLPASDAKWENPPRHLNFPFNTTSWFEKNSERFNINDYVHLHTEIWYYLPVRLKRVVNLLTMGANEPMGNLSISAQLNKLQGGKKLDLSNPHALADYIKWEYDDFYESPEQGKCAKGNNYAVRQEFGQLLARKGESYRNQYEAALRNQLMPTPAHFDQRAFGGGQWTCFQVGKDGFIPTQYFCLPLSESFYLHIGIKPTFHLNYRDVLEPDMLRAAEWLRQHIKITFPGKPAGPLALPQ